MSSLKATEETSGKASIIGPASLKGNFEKEKKKHGVKAKTDYSTYSKAEPKSKDLLIFDEAHRMGRSESQRSKYPEKFKSKKKLMLTGTPIRNEPSELIPLLRGVGADVPKSKEKFYEKYVENKKVDPGFIAKLRGIKPGETKDGKNILGLAEKLKGKVDYHKSKKEGYPDVNQKTVKVPMSGVQKETHDMAMKGKPSLAYKVKHGIPPSKTESSQMNAFLNATRQISNTPRSYNKKADPVEDSPKIRKMLEDITERQKKDKNYKGVTYSNYLDSGVNPMAKALKKRGISHAKFTGETPKSKRKEIVDKYNKGEIKHLLISGAGSEGLDLKGTKMLQVMEPHWNEARIDQVKGRPIRYKSHSLLPKGERNIDVREYLSVNSGNSKKKTTDQYISMLADKKEELNDDFKNAIILGSGLSNETKKDKDIIDENLKREQKINNIMNKKAEKAVQSMIKKADDLIAHSSPKVQEKAKEKGYQEISKDDYINKYKNNYTRSTKRLKDNISKKKKDNYIKDSTRAAFMGFPAGIIGSRTTNPKKFLASGAAGSLAALPIGLAVASSKNSEVDDKADKVLSSRDKKYNKGLQHIKNLDNEKIKYLSKNKS